MQTFFNEAKLVVHPFDSARSLPDELLQVLFDTLTKSPVDTMRHRLLKLQHWRALSKQLEPEEERIRSSMDPRVRQVLGGETPRAHAAHRPRAVLAGHGPL